MIARERIAALDRLLIAEVGRIDQTLLALQSEYRQGHQAIVNDIANLRTSIAVGPAELTNLARSEALRAGRQQGIGVSTNVMVVAVTLLLSAAGVIAAIIIASHS